MTNRTKMAIRIQKLYRGYKARWRITQFY